MVILRMLALVSMALCAGCGANSSVEIRGEPLIDQVSPDQDVRIVVARAGGNATVSDVYRVYAIDLRKPSQAPKPLLQADKLRDIDVQWDSPAELSISIGCAQVSSYTNFFYVFGGQNSSPRRVAVKLEPVVPCQ